MMFFLLKSALQFHECFSSVASLLSVNSSKLGYALCNTSVFVQGDAEVTQNTVEQAEALRDALARGLYSRMVDWLVNTLNINLILGRKVL